MTKQSYLSLELCAHFGNSIAVRLDELLACENIHASKALVQHTIDHAIEAHVFFITTHFAGARECKGPVSVERIHRPKDWWQHFKQRWLPAWALARWPVAMEEIEVERKETWFRVCPHRAVKWNVNQSPHIEWMANIDGKETP